MEESTLNNIQITSKIVRVQLTNFSVATISDGEKLTLQRDKFAYEYNVNIKLEPTQRLIIVYSNIKIFSDLTKTLYLGEIATTGTFELINLEDMLKKFSGSIPTFVFALFLGVVISTSRGFLLLKSEGTILEGATLPIVDSGSFFPQPIIKTAKPQ